MDIQTFQDFVANNSHESISLQIILSIEFQIYLDEEDEDGNSIVDYIQTSTPIAYTISADKSNINLFYRDKSAAIAVNGFYLSYCKKYWACDAEYFNCPSIIDAIASDNGIPSDNIISEVVLKIRDAKLHAGTLITASAQDRAIPSLFILEAHGANLMARHLAGPQTTHNHRLNFTSADGACILTSNGEIAFSGIKLWDNLTHCRDVSILNVFYNQTDPIAAKTYNPAAKWSNATSPRAKHGCALLEFSNNIVLPAIIHGGNFHQPYSGALIPRESIKRYKIIHTQPSKIT